MKRLEHDNALHILAMALFIFLFFILWTVVHIVIYKVRQRLN